MYDYNMNSPTVTIRTNIHVLTKLQHVTATLEREVQSVNLITTMSLLLEEHFYCYQ